jgi:2'-5' RNA ligase
MRTSEGWRQPTGRDGAGHAEGVARTRTFLALPLPAPVRAALAELRAGLPPAPRGVRWSDPAQAHATLVFLGDLDDSALAEVRDRTRAVAAATAPFDADLAGLGAFAEAGRARVLWIGWGAGAAAVARLQVALVAALERPPEPRPFAPHVTLARARDPVDARPWLAAAPAGWRSPTWRAEAVAVIASEMHHAGARHSVVERCPFGGA